MSRFFKRVMILFFMAVCISSIAGAGFLGSTPAPAHAAASPHSTALSAYIGSQDGYLYALDATTGSLKWRYNTGAPVLYASAVSSGIVYVPTANAIDALNASDGSLLWSYTTGGTAYAPAASSGVVYFNAGDTFLYALNASDGSFLWRSSLGSTYAEAYMPAIVNGVVYDTTAGSGQLFAFHASDGSLIWQDSQISEPISTAPTVSNGVAYIGAGYGWGCLIAAKASDGTPLVDMCGGTGMRSQPTIANGMIYFGLSQNRMGSIDAVDANTFGLVWHDSALQSGPADSRVAVRAGVVYEGSGKMVYALNASTGARIWARFLGSTIGTAGIVAAANGLVYMGAANGTLFALSQSSRAGRIVWRYVTGGSINAPPTIA